MLQFFTISTSHDKALQSWGLCGVMLILSFVQLLFSTMDPSDSGFICYEQCVYLSSTFALERVDQVIRKKDFVDVIEYRVEEEFKGRRIQHTDHNKQEQQDMNDIDELQERKDHETDKALAKTKSVSFNDLIKISGVLRIIVSSTLVAFNEQSCRILYKQAMTNM